jgi:soluble lytic murein transglycosylase-like protein
LIIIFIFIIHLLFANNKQIYNPITKLPNYEIQMKINYYAHKYFLDPYFVTAICYKESKYKIKAISKNIGDNGYSLGIMQINRNYYKHWKYKNFFDLDKNLDEGCKILRNCLNLADHNYFWGLVYYNFGYGNVNLKHKPVPDLTIIYASEIMALTELFKKESDINE